MKTLSRWEIIDVVRTMSTEQAKAGQEGKVITNLNFLLFWCKNAEHLFFSITLS